MFDNGAVHVYAVREISAYLRELLDSSPVLADVWVSGECSNVSRPSSGHVYFTLKDANAQLKCVFFANPRAKTSQLVENGNAVLAHGRIGLYEIKGDLQLIVDYVQPEGEGALQAEFERLKAQLGEEGLFDPGRKRQLPSMPARIGVVTSPSGAVFHDICRVLERRWPLAAVVLAPAPVQGPDAVAGIVGGLDALNALRDIDIIIVARGGGSLEELWAFNDEHVARAIFGSAAPVISAVGHETDFTIADYVADLRAPTPSVAAEIVAPDQAQLLTGIRSSTGALDSLVRSLVTRDRTAVSQSMHALDRRVPDIQATRQRIEGLVRRSLAIAERTHRDAEHGVGACVWRLKSLDPFATLDRGYAIVQKGGAVVSNVGSVKPGDALDVRVQDGVFEATVGGRGPTPRRRARKVSDAQAPLFTMPEERA